MDDRGFKKFLTPGTIDWDRIPVVFEHQDYGMTPMEPGDILMYCASHEGDPECWLWDGQNWVIKETA